MAKLAMQAHAPRYLEDREHAALDLSCPRSAQPQKALVGHRAVLAEGPESLVSRPCRSHKFLDLPWSRSQKRPFILYRVGGYNLSGRNQGFTVESNFLDLDAGAPAGL